MTTRARPDLSEHHPSCAGGDCRADHTGDRRYEAERRAELLARSRARHARAA